MGGKGGWVFMILWSGGKRYSYRERGYEREGLADGLVFGRGKEIGQGFGRGRWIWCDWCCLSAFLFLSWHHVLANDCWSQNIPHWSCMSFWLLVDGLWYVWVHKECRIPDFFKNKCNQFVVGMFVMFRNMFLFQANVNHRCIRTIMLHWNCSSNSDGWANYRKERSERQTCQLGFWVSRPSSMRWVSM